MPTIRVNIAGGPHDFILEPGALESLGARVRAVAPHQRTLLAIDEKIASTPFAAQARLSLKSAGFDLAEIHLRADESLKSLDTVRAVYDAMLAARLDRKSPVIAMGGGIVGDTAGFAAATFMRGVPLIHVPTTLLAMVDASIGGKTGVNFVLPGGQLGKNLIGAFHQPRLIVADPQALLTLDSREISCGLAECIKHGMIADPSILELLREHVQSLHAKGPHVLIPLIERSARVKIAIVERDEREGGERALLNLGHTFGHAIESMPELDLRHGEAVAIGLLAACACALHTRMIEPLYAEEVRDVIGKCLLPPRLWTGASLDRLMHAMRFDKKAGDGKLRLVLPAGRGKCEIVDDVPDAVIAGAWREVGAT